MLFHKSEPDTWSPLESTEFQLSEEYDREQWGIKRAAAHGGQVLQLPAGKVIRIRKSFTLETDDV